MQLELANPLHSRAVLETSTYANARLVLLHGSYPFMREASYLASVYPQVMEMLRLLVLDYHSGRSILAL